MALEWEQNSGPPVLRSCIPAEPSNRCNFHTKCNWKCSALVCSKRLSSRYSYSCSTAGNKRRLVHNRNGRGGGNQGYQHSHIRNCNRCSRCNQHRMHIQHTVHNWGIPWRSLNNRRAGKVDAQTDRNRTRDSCLSRSNPYRKQEFRNRRKSPDFRKKLRLSIRFHNYSWEHTRSHNCLMGRSLSKMIGHSRKIQRKTGHRQLDW